MEHTVAAATASYSVSPCVSVCVCVALWQSHKETWGRRCTPENHLSNKSAATAEERNVSFFRRWKCGKIRLKGFFFLWRSCWTNVTDGSSLESGNEWMNERAQEHLSYLTDKDKDTIQPIKNSFIEDENDGQVMTARHVKEMQHLTGGAWLFFFFSSR